MKKLLLILLIMPIALTAYGAQFTIDIPAYSSFAISNDKVVVECSQMMTNQNLQMSCSLPDQTITQRSTVSFRLENKVAGTMALNGVVNNSFEAVSLQVPYQSAPPYVFTYIPHIMLQWLPMKKTTLTCNNIVSRTAFCQVV